MIDLNRYYSDRIESFTARVRDIRKRINLIAALRLVTFISGIAVAIYIYRFSPWFTLITVAVFTAIFLILVRQSVMADEKKRFFNNLVNVNSRELLRFEGNITGFDPGKEFLSIDHHYSSDLDIFGKGSLFQLVNSTSTFQGKIRLAEWLLSGADEEEILLRQGSISELREKTEWRHEFQAHGMDLSETGQEFEEVTSWLNEKPYFLKNTFYRIAVCLLPSATLVLLILSFFLVPPNFLFFLVLLQLGITGINLRKINRQHNVMTKKHYLFSGYSRLFSMIEYENFSSAKIKRLKRIIDHFESGGMALVLLDEIFKGTNSKDKHLGSEILIRQLINYNADVIVATHDLELCRLEEELPGKVINCCFESYLENGVFRFDYILRKGICKTMNAKELMKQIGIPVNSNNQNP
jgi:hypothetical protein